MPFLQGFHLLFLALHDWVPLGPLNDPEAQRRADPLVRRLLSTLLSLLPFAVLFSNSVRVWRLQPWPPVLLFWMWVGYGLLFLGELRAWWIPYLLRPDRALAQRYQILFGRTHAFLPLRNGLRPNTLHVALHLATALLLAVLAYMSSAGRHR